LAKFRTFIEQEDFDAVEKRIVTDYAERSGADRWAMGIVGRLERIPNRLVIYSFFLVVVFIAPGDRTFERKGSSGAAVELVDPGRPAARRASHQRRIRLFRRNHWTMVDGCETTRKKK
jgi:hypothetical protein